MTTTGSATFTTTMGVIYRVHNNTTNRRSNSAPTSGTGFTQGAQVVLAVGNLTNGGAALNRHFTHLTTAQTQGGIVSCQAGWHNVADCRWDKWRWRDLEGRASYTGQPSRQHLDAQKEAMPPTVAERTSCTR